MIFRICIACLLMFACADDIDIERSRVSSEEPDGGNTDGIVFGRYNLKPPESEPTNMPSAAELLKVKFISKISATASLLVTGENKTWKYDEAANNFEAIVYEGDHTTPSNLQTYTILQPDKYTFSANGDGLARLYAKEDAKLVIFCDEDNAACGGGDKVFKVLVSLPGSAYDASATRILHIGAAGADTDPPVLMLTKDKNKANTFVLASKQLACEGQEPSPVTIKAGDKTTSSDKVVGGVGSDGKSIWIRDDLRFYMYWPRSCKLEGEKISYDYQHVVKKPLSALKILHNGAVVSGQPLGMWMEISVVDDEVAVEVKGAVLGISKDGKLLRADKPEPDTEDGG